MKNKLFILLILVLFSCKKSVLNTDIIQEFKYDTLYTTVKLNGNIIHSECDKIHKFNYDKIKEKRYNEGLIIIKNYK